MSEEDTGARGAGAGGPALAETLAETHGQFLSDAALQDAIGRLARAGFDRAQMSLPKPDPGPGETTPGSGAANPNTEDDARNVRAVHVGTAAAAAGMAGAAVVAATGGAALAVAAAGAALGAVVGGGAFVATTASNEAEQREREHAARQGGLVLSVTLRAPQDAAKAEQALREAGATEVRTVERRGAGAAMGDFSDRDVSLLP